MEPKIKFTSETSITTVTFLDLRIYKPPNFSTTRKLATSIHYKRTNTFSYAHGTTHVAPNTLRGVAIGETIRALRNCNKEAKFLQEQRQIEKKFKRRGYAERVLSAIRRVKFSQRRYYLEKESRRHIE